MVPLLILSALIVVLIGGTLVALWMAPEGEETPTGFQVVGTSGFQRFWARLTRRWKRRTRVGGLKHDPHP